MSNPAHAIRYFQRRLDEILRDLNKAESAHHVWALKASLQEPDKDPTSWYTHYTLQARLAREEADHLWRELKPSGAVRPADAHEGYFRLTWQQEQAWLESKYARYDAGCEAAHEMTPDGYNQAEMERDAALVLKSMNWTYDGAFWRPPTLTYEE